MKKFIYMMAMALAVIMTACDNDFAYPPVIMGEIKGDGTAEAPYNIAKAIRVAAANGETSDVFCFVAGYVVSGSIDTSYGNATWDLYDNPEGTGQKLIAYRVKNFNNMKFTTESVKLGDYVVLYTPLINFRGNTPETGTGGYLYSVNGVIGSDVPDTPAGPSVTIDPAGDGTAASPYNVAKAIQVAKTNGETSETSVYTEGYVISGSIDTSYGNGTWVISDNPEGTASTITVYRAKDLGDKKFTDANKVKVGDKIVVCAPIINFKGNTPETNLGYLYSINGVTGTQTPDTPDTPDTPEGVIYSSLTDNAEGWTFNNVKMPEALTYVWTWDSSYKNLKASAYNQQAYESDSYAITNVDLSAYKKASLTFDHAYKFAEDAKKVLTCVIRVKGETAWNALTIPEWPTGKDWTFVSAGTIDISAYAGKKVEIAFRYQSSTSEAATWEIKNFSVSATK